MEKLAELFVKTLINEAAMNQDVMDAIKKRFEVEITYDDGEKTDAASKGRRVIQPVAFFKTPKGNLAIRAYQTFGDSKTRKSHGWKEFKLDNIIDWKPNKKKRFKEPPMYKEEGLFNKDDDKGGIEIYAIANFNGQKNDALMKYNKRINDKKVEKSPYYNLGRGIKKGYDGTENDFLSKNVADWQKTQAAQDFHSGNWKSINDMSKIQDFGDRDSTTSGPVTKGNTETSETESEPVNYTNAIENGPQYKNTNKKPEEDEFDDIDIDDVDFDTEMDDDFLEDLANRKYRRKR